MNQSKISIAALVAVLAAALILAVPAGSAFANHDSGQGKSQDNKNKGEDKCNNVKIRVNVEGVEVGEDVTASATLAGSTISKTIEDVTADDLGEDGILTVAFNFKKLDPCPKVGDSFSGTVNGVSFSDELDSLKKPNKIDLGI